MMPYNPSIFITWLRKILEQAGLTKVTLHSLRHTNISLQLMAGIDIKTVAGRVGHSQISTTVDINNRHKSIEKLENWSKIKVRFA